MAGLTGVSNQAPRLVSGYLNSENNPAPGVPLSSPSGSIVQPYGGLVGGKLFLSTDDAKKLSNTSVGTLYCGIYQMVIFRTAVVRGTLAFWDISVADNLFQVSQDETLNGGIPLIAGVCIGAVSAGNQGWIQIEGKATVKIRTTVTSATRYIVWAAAGAGADNATADGQAAGATFNSGMANSYLGVGEAAASSGAMLIIDMVPKIFRQ